MYHILYIFINKCIDIACLLIIYLYFTYIIYTTFTFTYAHMI